MTDNKTVTFDASQYQIAPKVPTDEMRDAGNVHVRNRSVLYDAWKSMLAAAPTPAAQSAGQEAVARYIVIGYGESDYPMAAFANDADELLDAVLGMMYTKPSDACDDTREEYRCLLADEDEWCAEVWRKEFEIGGIVVYDTGEHAGPVNGGERACKCDMRTRLVGDGCDVCNPELARDLSEREELQTKVSEQADKISELQELLDTTHVGDMFAANAPQVGGDEHANRYRVERASGGFWPNAVRCGTGTRELFVGHKKQCERVAAELKTAFEDGRFVERTAALSSSAKVGGDEREAFEAAVIRYFAQKHPGNTLSKGIVDWRGENGDYAERPVVHGMWKGWQARAALSADAGEELRLYRWLKDNGRELLTSACQGGWRYAISGEPAPQNWHATADDAIRAAIAANQSGKGGE